MMQFNMKDNVGSMTTHAKIAESSSVDEVFNDFFADHLMRRQI